MTDLNAAVQQAAEDAARQTVAQLESRIRFLEERLAQLTRPKTLLTEREAAELLRVHIQSLKRWREEKPPRIPFVAYEGGDIRYRVEDLESYLKSRERGKRAALRAA